MFFLLREGDNALSYEPAEVPANDARASFGGSSFEEVEDSLSSFSDSDSGRSEKTTADGGKRPTIKRPSKAIRTLKQRYRYILIRRVR